MIVADSSAIIAIMQQEPEELEFLALMQTEKVAISAVTLFECGVVLFARRREAGQEDIRKLLSGIDARIIPFDELSAAYALEAFRRYGKGIHKARLNFGDCASYALAKQLDAPLLFKGTDFAETDVKRCI